MTKTASYHPVRAFFPPHQNRLKLKKYTPYMEQMCQAKFFENEKYRRGIRHYGGSVHLHFVVHGPAKPGAQGGEKMVQSTVTEMVADVSLRGVTSGRWQPRLQV